MINLGVVSFSIITQKGTVLKNLRKGIHTLQQGQYASDGPSEISSAEITYMYINTNWSEVLLPIDSTTTTWFSRYLDRSWVKHH